MMIYDKEDKKKKMKGGSIATEGSKGFSKEAGAKVSEGFKQEDPLVKFIKGLFGTDDPEEIQAKMDSCPNGANCPLKVKKPEEEESDGNIIDKIQSFFGSE